MSFLKFTGAWKHLVYGPKMLRISIRSNSKNIKILTNFNVALLPAQSCEKIRGFGTFPDGHSSSSETETFKQVSLHLFEKVSEETLENLAEVLDQLLEETYPKEFDVSLSNGVLTVQLEDEGTYVINKQTPNRQIWLSSPTSGPKRYDYVKPKWVYSHDRTSLDNILSQEFSKILKQPVKIVSLHV